MSLASPQPQKLSPPLSTSSPPLVQLVRVSKDYDTGGGVVHAMRDVSLAISQGELVAVVGASGSGKSTMMNILGCLDRPTVGSYTLGGIEVGERPGDSRAIVRNRVIGFVFQGFNLLSRTTARENVELPLQYRGVRARERRRRARAALEAVGLGDRMDHTPNQLSGGQQQRVASARALVTEPPLLLADEPTGNLDTRTSFEVLALLQKLNRERGITVVVVTHEPDVAACASRVITMRDGRIVSDVAQSAPVDAAAQIARMPEPDADPARPAQQPASATLHTRALPLSVFGIMLLGELAGTGIAAGYASLLAGFGAIKAFWLQRLLGECTLAWAGSRWARRVLSRSPTRDERVRMALGYTSGVTLGMGGAMLAVTLLLAHGRPTRLEAITNAFEHLSARGAPVLVAVVCLAAGLLVLLRYLLLTLFGSKR
jgi:putative ABC transport system ATP-binding protein